MSDKAVEVTPDAESLPPEGGQPASSSGRGRAGGRGRRWAEKFARPPRLPFHLIVMLPTLALLVAFSVPGLNFFLAMGSFVALAVCALVWGLRGAAYLWARRRGEVSGSPRWFLIAPLAGGLVVALVWLEVPLRMRWATSRDDFARAVEAAPPPGARDDWISFEVPSRLGSYRILHASRVGNGVIFYESTGNLFDDAGFAYLPTGPFDELNTGSFESPQFRSLGDGWYAWTASW